MKMPLLMMVFTGLLLGASSCWSEAAPLVPPARLWERASLDAGGRELVHWSTDCLAFSADSRILATADCGNGAIHLWDVANQKVAATLRQQGVMNVVFSPDRKTLASCDGKYVMIWDVASRESTAKLRGDVFGYWALFNPDGKKLLVVEKGWLTEWDAEKKKQLRDRRTSSRPIRVSAYPSTRRPLLAVREPWDRDNYQRITLIDAFTGESVITCAGHKHQVSCVAMDREETMLATSGDDQTLRLWDRSTGAKIAAFETESDNSGSVVFSPDGKVLAAAFAPGLGFTNPSSSYGFRLYEVSSGKVLAEVKCSYITALAFSPDGRLLATAGTGGPIKLWSVPAAWQKKK